MARAAATAMVSSETVDSTMMSMRARVVTGAVSVGLNAVAVVNDRKT
jgi:hypothetical protein